MSVPTDGTTPGQEPEAITLSADAGAAMGEILSFLAPEEGEQEAGAGAGEAPAPADGSGQQQPAAEGAGGDGAAGGAPAAGDGGEPVVPDGGDGAASGEPAAGAQPASGSEPGWTVDADSLTDSWGEVAESFETRQAEYFRQDALAEMHTEYPKYFDAIQQHPRALVGQEVPSATGEGMERLRDAADAASWQDAIKHQLVQEVQSRVETRTEDMRETFTTVHASIDLFRNNADLVPGTKQFDRELADQFAQMAQDYELRADGKLVGYSVPVQPMINQLRSQLASRRTTAAAAAAAPAGPSAAQQRAAEQPRARDGRWDGPQAGLRSKAGQSGAAADDPAAGLMDAFYRQNGITI